MNVFREGYALPDTLNLVDPASRVTFVTRAMALEISVRLSLRIPGNIVEFGVASGASTRIIRRTLRRYSWTPFIPHRRKRIFALDSFEGLQEQFENAAPGTFAGAVPRIGGVTFVQGFFEETCTPQLAEQVGRVALAHLDADLHGSTLTALRWLSPLLGPGSLLLFDEFTGGEHAEQRAFAEWRKQNDLRLIRLAEFDRDPSGFGTVPDRRLLYQVVAAETLDCAPARGSWPWLIDYYLGRLGLDELRSRFASRY